MESIYQIIRINGYTQNDEHWIKPMSTYTSQLTLYVMDDEYIRLCMVRVYVGRSFVVANLVYRMGRLIQCLDDLIKGEYWNEISDEPNLVHMESTTFNPEIENQLRQLRGQNYLDLFKMPHLVRIHGVESGVCWVGWNVDTIEWQNEIKTQLGTHGFDMSQIELSLLE